MHDQANKKFFHIYFSPSDLSHLKKENFKLLFKRAYALINSAHHNDLAVFSKNYIDAKNTCVQAIFFYGLAGYVLYLNVVTQGLDILNSNFKEITQCEANRLFEILLITEYFLKNADSKTELLKHYPKEVMLTDLYWKDKRNEIINKLGLTEEDISQAEEHVSLLMDFSR